MKKSQYSVKPAIVVVTYNRPKSVARLLESIKRAYFEVDDITLIISIDYSNINDEMLKIANDFNWQYGKKIINKHKENLGLKKHILECGDYSKKYGAVIVLEDDLVVSKNFYSYILQALNFYYDNENIAGISLYSHAWNGYAKVPFIPEKNSYDVYFGQYSISWGQCWTEYQWNSFKEWMNKSHDYGAIEVPRQVTRWGNKSWGKYYAYYISEVKKYYVVPYISLTTNCSESGEHNSYVSSAHQVMLLETEKYKYRFPKIEAGIKYNLFFERIFKNDIVKNIKNEDICVDLNGENLYCTNKTYVLTCCKYNVKPLKTFGIERRPIEENILNFVDGVGIYLYRSEDVKNKKGKMSKNYIYYYYLDYKIFTTLRYIINKTPIRFVSIMNTIKKLNKK